MRLGLSALAAYDTTKCTASYYASFFNDLIRSVIDIFSGDQEMWYFYDEFCLPIQAPAVATDNRDIMCWTYLKRSKQFIHRCGAVASKKIDYPWLSATLVIPSIYEEEEPYKCDFSGFLEETAIYCDRVIAPTPNMLLSAWSVQNRRWLTPHQRRGAYFEVITQEGDEIEVPAWIRTIRGYGVWMKSIGREIEMEEDSDDSDEAEGVQIAPEPLDAEVEAEVEAEAEATDESKKMN